MAVGSSTLATMRAAPPQFTQVVTSMLNTRLRRCAQVIERRRSSGVRGSAGSGGVSWVAFDGSRLPRPEGVRCARGGGTSAASLAMNSMGSNSTCVVPLRHGVLSW